jgi:hypothetical protein
MAYGSRKGPLRLYEYNKSDPWFVALKNLEIKHRERINQEPYDQLRNLYFDLVDILKDEPIHQSIELQKQNQESLYIQKKKYLRRQKLYTRWFLFKFWFTKLVTQESTYTILRDMIDEKRN